MAPERMTLEQWLDDLCVRFIINLPRQDLESPPRICFQIEEAQWFYEDFIRPLDPNLPSMSLKNFSIKMFQHCPLFATYTNEMHHRAFEMFMQYKTRVPVRGAIMLNDAMDAVVLVRGYKKGSRWSFPRGKINKDEDDLDCAVREVYEETGYDLRKAGLVERNTPAQPLEVIMHDQQVLLYVFRGVPEDTVFETRTRKEIGDIKWYSISDLPAYRKKKGAAQPQSVGKEFYMVAPFMVGLKQWVLKQKKAAARRLGSVSPHNHPSVTFEENLTEDNMMDESIQQEAAELPLPSSHLQFGDGATSEMHQLLQPAPATRGLEVPSPTSNQHAGQTLLSILQPNMPARSQDIPHTPHDQEVAEAPQPTTPHYRHPTQRLGPSDHIPPPSFPVQPTANISYMQQYQHWPRPSVYVPIDAHRPAAVLDQNTRPRHLPNPPVQLLHPQPLPPQVQKAMLLRGFVPSPMNPEFLQQAAPFGPSQDHGRQAGSVQYEIQPTRGVHLENKVPAELPAHTANLLNVLKGNQPSVQQNQQIGQQDAQKANVPPGHQHQQRPLPAANHGFPTQYNPTNAVNESGARAGDISQAISQVPSLGILRPTDKHRAGLLDMFKQAQSPVSKSQVDDQGATLTRSRNDANVATTKADRVEHLKQHRPKQGASTIEAAGGTFPDHDRHVRINPETNLPYGAFSILQRPQAGQTSSLHSPTTSTRGSDEPSRALPVHAQASPSSSFGSMSPHQSQFKTKPLGLGKATFAGQPSPLHSSFPYGGAPETVPNPLSMYTNPPSTSSLPTPDMMKPRQGSTLEQKSALLSLFGKPGSGNQQGKDKETVARDDFGAKIPSKSRLTSVASGAGEVSAGSGSTRKGSQTPLSPADHDFLVGFLKNAAINAKR